MKKYVTQRPEVTVFIRWDGDNIEEFEENWPSRTFSVNPDGSLHDHFFIDDIPVGYWYGGAGAGSDADLHYRWQELSGDAPWQYAIEEL